MSPYTGPRCPRCGGFNAYTDTHPARPARVRCADCEGRRVPYSDHKLPTLIAIAQARLLVSEASDRCTLHGEPAVWIRASDLKIILDALDPQC